MKRNLMSRAARMSLAKRRMRCVKSLRRSRLGLMAQTMSLIVSTISREVLAIISSGSVTEAPSRPTRWFATSLRMAICERLAPMSSCRSVAMRVRTRSISRSRRTR